MLCADNRAVLNKFVVALHNILDIYRSLSQGLDNFQCKISLEEKIFVYFMFKQNFWLSLHLCVTQHPVTYPCPGHPSPPDPNMASQEWSDSESVGSSVAAPSEVSTVPDKFGFLGGAQYTDDRYRWVSL